MIGFAKVKLSRERLTNTVDGFYNIFKGVYQFGIKQYLHRFAAEFGFSYSSRVVNDVEEVERGEIALSGAAGKWLTDHQSNQWVRV